MAIVRRSLGFGTILLSVSGLILCLAGIVGICMVKSRVETVGDAVLGAAEEALAFVDDKLDRVKQILNRSQEPVRLLSRAAERLQRKEPQAKEELTSLLQTFDGKVLQELKSAQSWLDSAHAVAVGVGRVSQAVVSSEYAATRQDTIGMALAVRLQESSESVAEILAKLQVLREELVKLRDTGVVARQVAAAIVARLVDLESRLNHLASGIERLGLRVAETRDDVRELKQSFPWWTTVAALVLALLPAWFAVSQIVMTRQGWRLARGTFDA